MKNLVSAMVVDDSVSMRRYVSALLQGGLGIELVLEAANADDAVHLIRANEDLNIGCVFSDLEMPGMAAKDFIAFLRSNPRTANVPCVLLSGRTRVVVESIALRDGFTTGLSKPFSPEQFIEKMSRIWHGKERRRSRRVSPCLGCEIDFGFGDEHRRTGELVNISMTGCLVRIPASMLPSVYVYCSELVTLKDGDGESTHLDGKIVRVEADLSSDDGKFALIAINFTTLDERDRAALGDYIGKCDKSAQRI